MGDSLDKVIALAGTVRVESHKRVSKSGKVTDVDAYTRSLRGMSIPELQAEAGKSSNDRMKQSQVTNELRRRGAVGTSDQDSALSAELAEFRSMDPYDLEKLSRSKATLLYSRKKRSALQKVLQENKDKAFAKYDAQSDRRIARALSKAKSGERYPY